MTQGQLILSVILVFLKNISEVQCAIRCYKCLVESQTHYTSETPLLCKNFDYSEKFIVDCPFSTYCMKTITSAKISEPINGTERDCANQKLETKQYYDGKWNDEVYIEEPYKEGCSLVNDKGARTLTIEHCYCQGDLCNSSNHLLQMKYITMLMTVITTFKII